MVVLGNTVPPYPPYVPGAPAPPYPPYPPYVPTPPNPAAPPYPPYPPYVSTPAALPYPPYSGYVPAPPNILPGTPTPEKLKLLVRLPPGSNMLPIPVPEPIVEEDIVVVVVLGSTKVAIGAGVAGIVVPVMAVLPGITGVVAVTVEYEGTVVCIAVEYPGLGDMTVGASGMGLPWTAVVLLLGTVVVVGTTAGTVPVVL
jgi:hypothetical protein